MVLSVEYYTRTHVFLCFNRISFNALRKIYAPFYFFYIYSVYGCRLFHHVSVRSSASVYDILHTIFFPMCVCASLVFMTVVFSQYLYDYHHRHMNSLQVGLKPPHHAAKG